MKIAFLNRGRVHPGGDLVALDATMEALRKRGHTCVETGWDRQALRAGNFDLAHIYHCNFDWSWGNYEAVRDVGLKYALTPIYYPGPLLSGIASRQLAEIFAKSAAMTPFSDLEVTSMYNDDVFGRDDRCTIIPNGTSPKFHGLNHTILTTHPSVLCVSARGREDKGVPMVERICDRMGVLFECATTWPHHDLPRLYTSYLVFVNASTSERMSLSIGEALCAGCRVLATNANWGNEWYPGLVQFDPADEIKLEHLIRFALQSPSWDYRPNEAARCISWDWHAEQLERVYQGVRGTTNDK